MKKLITLAISILTLTTFAQQSSPWKKSYINTNIPLSFQQSPNTVYQVIDSIYTWEWDTIASGWVFYNKSVEHVFDSKNNLLNEVIKHHDGNTWVNQDHYSYTYDAANNPVATVIDAWDGSAWANSTKESMVYDSNNNRTSEASLSWNGSAWENSAQYFFTYNATNKTTEEWRQQGNGTTWENDFKHFLTYDANDNILTDGRQVWDKPTSTWVNETRTLATYDASNLITKKEAQSWNNNAWVTFIEFYYTYDSNKNLVEQLQKSSQGANQVYDTYSYDGNNNLVHRVHQNWTGTAWKNQYQYFYEYDGHKNNTLGKSEFWNGTGWIPYTLSLENYDQDNFIKTSSERIWNKTGTKIAGGDSTTFYYHIGTTQVKEMISANNQLKIYPNPTSGNFKILLENKQAIINAEIYNMKGELIRRGSDSEYNINNEAAGIYLLKVITGNQLFMQRIVLE